MTRIIKLPQVQNVGPNQKATLKLPLGRTYGKIFLFCEGNIARALLSNIVLSINAGERQRWKTSVHLQAKNSYNKLASDLQVLELNFIEPEGKDEAAMTLGTYALTEGAGVQDAVLEFDIGAYVITAGSKIQAVAEVDLPSKNTLIVRTRYQQKTLSGAVEEAINLPYGLKGEQVKRMYIFGTLASIEKVRVRREDSDEFDDVTVFQNEYMQKTYGKVPQAGLMVIDFIKNNLQNNMLNTALIMGADGKVKPVENLDIRLSVNAGGTFDIYTETLTTNDRA